MMKDESSDELSLLYPNNYKSARGLKDSPTIAFGGEDDFKTYLNRHCVTESKIKNSGNGIFMFLILIIIITLIIGSIMMIPMKKVSTSNFGSFSY